MYTSKKQVRTFGICSLRITSFITVYEIISRANGFGVTGCISRPRNDFFYNGRNTPGRQLVGFLILYAEDVNGEKETEGIEREIDIWAANQKI